MARVGTISPVGHSLYRGCHVTRVGTISLVGIVCTEGQSCGQGWDSLTGGDSLYRGPVMCHTMIILSLC